MDTNLIYRGDCYTVLKRHFPENSIDLIYLDPPFSFNPKYARLWYDKETLEMFGEMTKGEVRHFVSWMSRRLEQCHRVLKDTGSIYLHCDSKFGHYLKIEMDNIFSRNNFRNEIIWHYTGGGRAKRYFSRKHDNLFFYSKTNKFTFNIDEIRVPYKETSGYARSGIISKTGKQYLPHPKGTPVDDVWDIPIINPLSKERVGYPTQKPEKLLERIIKASSNSNDIVLDPMCGCGTTITVAHKLDRKWIGIDISSQACEVMKERIESLEGIIEIEIEIRGLPLTTKDLKKLTPFEFEDYICDMTNSEKTQHIADKGIDGYYLGEIPLQIKQQKRIGRKVVDEFETALRRKNKNKGYVIGFSFTKGAYEEVARAKDDELDIELVNVDELIKFDYDLEALLE